MASQNPRRSGNPARRPTLSNNASEVPQGAFYDVSRALLTRMTRLPAVFVPAMVLALMLVGMLAPLAVALVALLVIGVFCGWLAVLSWPLLDLNSKLMRGVMMGIVVVSMVGRIQGWL